MLTQAIGALLPAALAVALSPVPIIAIVVVLGTTRARTVGPAFALGWVAGLTAVSAIMVTLASGADDPDSAAATGVNWLQVGIGVLFLAMAAKRWKKRPQEGQEPEQPGWMATIDTVSPSKAMALGMALSGANPKNLALIAAAASSIAQVGLDSTDTAIAVAVFVAIGSATVAGSVLFYLIAPDRAEQPLTSIKQFMSANSAVIMMVILLVMGAKLLGDGIGAF